MGDPLVTDTVPSDADESLAPATEELVFRVMQPGNPGVDELIGRFPEAAEVLRETLPVLLDESTVALTRSASETKPASKETEPKDPEETAAHRGSEETEPKAPEETAATEDVPGSLARARAREICRRFECDLQRGLGPRIEDGIREVYEPQRSALLSMLLAV